MEESRYEIFVDGKSVAKDVVKSLLPHFLLTIFEKYHDERDIEVSVKRYEADNENEVAARITDQVLNDEFVLKSKFNVSSNKKEDKDDEDEEYDDDDDLEEEEEDDIESDPFDLKPPNEPYDYFNETFING